MKTAARVVYDDICYGVGSDARRMVNRRKKKVKTGKPPRAPQKGGIRLSVD